MNATPLLSRNLLKKVSRSFYLSLRVLPAGMREPVGLAYLIARAADTIADTQAVEPARRRAALEDLREAIKSGGTVWKSVSGLVPAQTRREETELLNALPEALACLKSLDETDGCAVRSVLDTLTEGMCQDLDLFPPENAGRIAALTTKAELDRYTYLVAGCVGEFWTAMMERHALPADSIDDERMVRLGIRFGQALQMVNVLRDCPNDLRIGRCYLPREMIAACGLAPEQLLNRESAVLALAIMHTLVRSTLDDFLAAIDYLLLIPASHRRLRLACLWPIVIGLETLLAHVRNPNWLSPEHVSKIPRRRVYAILLVSLVRVESDDAIRAWTSRLIRDIRTRLTHGATGPETLSRGSQLG